MLVRLDYAKNYCVRAIKSGNSSTAVLLGVPLFRLHMPRLAYFVVYVHTYE
jgi:hypothetical protein